VGVKRRLSHDAFDVFGSRTAVTLMGTVTGIALARTLGPHDRGVLALVLLLPSTLLTVAKLGVTQANVYCTKREGAPVTQVAANSLFLALVLGGGLGVIVWTCRGLVLNTVMREVPAWALLLALYRLPLALIDNYFCGVLQAIDNFSLYNRRTVAGAALILILTLGAWAVGRLDLFVAVLIYTVVGTLVIIALLRGTHRLIPFGIRPDRALLETQVRFGVKSYTQVLAMHLLFRMDIYMISYYLTPAATAFYSLALHFTEMILEIPQAVGWVIYPRMASLSKEEVHRLTAQAARRTVLLTGLGGLAVAIFGPVIVPLWYGQAFAAAVRPLLFATVGMVSMSVFTIITRDFTSRNKQRVNIRAGTVALLSNLGLNLWMIPRFGIAGAAVATSLSYTLAAVLVLVAFRADSGIALREALVPKREDVRFVWRAFWQAVRRYGVPVPVGIAAARAPGAGARLAGGAPAPGATGSEPEGQARNAG
jgi:O-antigen/teichoic acid export membrane protein